MTTDQRLDRIERILTLFVNAGRRERKRVREVDEKITILINAQINNEDGFRELRERFKETDRKFQETTRQIQETGHQLQETDRRMRETVRELHQIGDLFRITDERINRLDEAQKRNDRKLDELSERS